MKIFISTSNIGLGSGASWAFIRLCQQLKDRGIDVVALVPRGGGIYDELIDSNIKTYVVRQSNYTWQRPIGHIGVKFCIHRFLGMIINFCAELRITQIVKTEHIDLIHMNALTGFVAGKVAVKQAIPLVWHIREFMEEDMGSTFINKKMSVDLINKSNFIIPISKSIENKYKSIFKQPTYKRVYDGIPIQQYYKEHEILTNVKISLAMTGRIVEQKGQLILIKAVGILKLYGFNNVEVNIYGPVNSPSYLEQIKKFISANELSSVIHLRGQLKEVSGELQKNDILCMCSYKEGFGLSTVEGMMAGCLVIGYASGATEELIEDKITGLTFKERDAESLAEKIKWVIENRNEAKNIALSGQKYAVENFSVERNADGVISVYRKLIKE